MAKKSLSITAKEKRGKEKRVHIEVVRQMLTLATSGFGLVAALAWNSLIQDIIAQYIKPYFPEGSIISLVIYAVIVTAIAVIVTLQLSKLLKRLEEEE